MARIEKLRSFGARSLSRAQRQWKLNAFDTALACAIALVGVVLLTAAGAFSTPETWLYDVRTRHFSFGRPAPTTRLVHLDMDDASIRGDELGRWPWHRDDQAALLEELAEARPKAVALDIIYDEPEKVETRKLPDGTTVDVDHDALLEAAFRRLGCAILGSSHADVGGTSAHGPYYSRLVEVLRGNLGTGEGAAVASLGLKGEDEVEQADQDFRAARDDAVADAVAKAMSRGITDRAGVARAVTGEDDVRDDNPLGRAILAAWTLARSQEAIRTSRFPAARDAALARLDARPPKLVPLERFTDAAAATAFFTYMKSSDGSVRTMPIVANLGGQVSMSLGLALAARTLDVPLDKIDLLEDRLDIRAASGTISVPLRTARYDELPRPIGGVMDLAWIGPHGADAWQKMYGEDQAVSIVNLWEVVKLRRRIAANNRELRRACMAIAENLPRSVGESIEGRQFDATAPGAWAPAYADLVRQIGGAEGLATLAEAGDPGPEPPKPASPSPADPKARAHDLWQGAQKAFLAAGAVRAAPKLIAELAEQGSQLDAQRKRLRHLFEGKSVMMGWTATGLTDFVTTPLHPAAPGVRIHGLVFNSIMTGNFVRFAPEWANLLLTLALGALMMGAVVRHSPLFSACVAIGFVAAYTGANVYAFGPHAYVLALAAPLAAVGATWAVGSVVKYRLEQKAVERIKKRFSTYVDPELVNFLLANPDKAELAGERREMTVCFTDLAGFTTISERLGEGTVPLLNRYFNAMFPVIRRHRGYINKLMGDGMMFFYNGINPNPRHAADAFETVLDLQAELRRFNAALLGEGLTTVKMRVGITTGPMIAGNAGGSDFSDFTVLGDIVNLASRLEGANKKSGTLIICNADARAQAGEAYVTRPIGVIRVVGKTQGIEAFEIVARRAEASPETLAMAELTATMVAAFRAGKLDECERLAAEVAPAELGELYLHQCADLRANGIPEGFDGTITLDSK